MTKPTDINSEYESNTSPYTEGGQKTTQEKIDAAKEWLAHKHRGATVHDEHPLVTIDKALDAYQQLEKLRCAAKEVVIHLNLGTLTGKPKALVACGDLSAFLYDLDKGR